MFTFPRMMTWPILERSSLVTSELMSPVEEKVGAAGLARQGEEEKAEAGDILGTHWRRGLIGRNSTILASSKARAYWSSGNHRFIVIYGSCFGT